MIGIAIGSKTHAMNKVYPDAAAALHDVSDGATILAGGFGLSGNPENCIRELARKKVMGLTIVSNNCGTTDKGLGILLAQGQVKKMVSSYVGENKIFEQQFLSGQLEVELCPQGTLAERLRAGGAGIEGFYTPTGFGTKVAEGKETRDLGGPGDPKMCVLEKAIRGDFAIVKAWRGDRWGNLVFRKTSRNFNPLCAQAGRVTIVEVEELVEVGALDPDHIHLPSIYVQRIFQGTAYEKPIEQRTLTPRTSEAGLARKPGAA
jgi:3-oxoacid CoA-transferase subunit A